MPRVRSVRGASAMPPPRGIVYHPNQRLGFSNRKAPPWTTSKFYRKNCLLGGGLGTSFVNKGCNVTLTKVDLYKITKPIEQHEQHRNDGSIPVLIY